MLRSAAAAGHRLGGSVNCVGRTTTETDDSDDELMRRLVRQDVIVPMTPEEALAMQGHGWDGDLDAMRGPHYDEAE